MNRRRETEKIILLCMRHFVLYRYYGIIVLKSQLLRRKDIVTIRSNIKGREASDSIQANTGPFTVALFDAYVRRDLWADQAGL